MFNKIAWFSINHYEYSVIHWYIYIVMCKACYLCERMRFLLYYVTLCEFICARRMETSIPPPVKMILNGAATEYIRNEL